MCNFRANQSHEVMAIDLNQKLKPDIAECKYFSLQFDESIDVAQLSIFIRTSFTDMTWKEDLLTKRQYPW